jgi:type I restriction enzyme S subunit
LNADQVGNLPFPALPIANQRAIGDYLDVETARIDTLIAKKQRLIGRLQLRFEYLTEESVFPTSASRTRLDRLTNPARRIMYGIVLPGPDVGEGAPIVKGGNVRDHRIGGHVCHTTDEIESGYVRSRLAPGDLVVIIRGAGAGRVAVVTEENAGWNITQDVARVSPGARTSTEWLRLVLESRPVQEQLRVRVGGAAITGINIWDLQRLEVPDVPLGEQRRVAEAVGDAERAHELLVRTLHRQIDLLAEHRQALITAAVTGELEMAGLA